MPLPRPSPLHSQTSDLSVCPLLLRSLRTLRSVSAGVGTSFPHACEEQESSCLAILGIELPFCPSSSSE